MAAFWLGTLPALMGASILARFCSQKFLFKLQGLTPAVLILLGVVAVLAKSGAFPGLDSATHCFDLMSTP
jgi:sulfite exporter TauE/SafE